jgi:Sec-independent protein translocase protein TatA
MTHGNSMRTLIALSLITCLSLSAAQPASTNFDDSPLAEAMSSLNSSMRSFRKAVKGDAPDQKLALAELMKMQAAVQSAKTEVPEIVSGLDAKKAAAKTADYRKTLISCQRALLDLEVLVVDKKFSEVDLAIRGLLSMKKAGHDAFIEDV